MKTNRGRVKTKENLIGREFGRLYVIAQGRDAVGPSGKRISRWICECECGEVLTVLGGNLKSGSTGSCGCLRSEAAAQRSTTHGMSGAPEYSSWTGMISRCYNKKGVSYKDYGGRGIIVCDQWRNDFRAFYNDVGPKPAVGVYLG